MKKERKAIIKVKNIIKRYNDFTAVNDVSFEVYKGEIFGLLGPNGAGKTTTLEIIETLREPSEGDVIVKGISVTKEPERIKDLIGVQLQESGFYPNLNLREILQLFAGLYQVEIDAIELLSKVGLKEKESAIFNKLSGGQKQRFSIATTLVNTPDIIFLDEPTTGLDPQARRNLWELIKELRDSGITIVITTHYMDEAQQLCDRVGIMENGKLIALDTPEKLIDKLIASGFKKKVIVKEANLEDVFINLTGHEWKDE